MSREAFEAWWSATGQFHRAGGGEYEKTFAFHAWPVAQADAFERSAKVCEESAAAYGGIAEGPIATDYGKMVHEAMAVGASNCATIIRALAKEAGNA